MAGKLRVHVKFGETKVLVPCGDGTISVSEMVEKAIGRYKKAKKLHEDDRVVPHRLYQDGGSVVDLDDEVCAVLDDKEMVILEYQYFPHDAAPDYVPVTIGAVACDSNTSSTPEPSTQILPPQPATQSHVTNGDIMNPAHYAVHNGLVEPSPSSLSGSPLPPSSSSLQPPQRATRSTLSVAREMDPYLVNQGYQNGYSESEYTSSPQDPYLGGVPYGNNQFRGSRDTLLDSRGDPSLEAENAISIKVSGFHPSETSDLNGPPLSQIGNDATEHFTGDDPSINNPSSSQVSVHSFDGTSQPSLGGSQRFIGHSPPVNYDLELLTPSSQVGENSYSETHQKLEQHPSVSQNCLDATGSKVAPLDSPSITTANRFSFTTSQSMEHLNELQMGRGVANSNLDPGGGSPYHQLSFRSGSQFGHPALSQEIPFSSMSHNQSESFQMTEPPYVGGQFVMSQFEPHGWPHKNPRMYSNMPRHGYPPHRAQPQQGGQYRTPEFHTGGGRLEFNDRNSVGSSVSEQEFRTGHPLPNSMYPPFVDNKDRRRKTSMQEYHYEESMRMGRAPQHPSGYPEMYGGYLRPYHHGPEDDPALSQPTPYVMYPHHPYSWYPPNFQPHMGGGPQPGMGMGMGMNRMGNTGRLTNTPSGYSLSQGGEPRSRHFGFGNEKGSGKPRKGVLKNSSDFSSKERRNREDSTSKDSKYSIEEERLSDEEDPDIDDMKPSPFRRSSRKSMYLDDASVWGRWQEKLDHLDLDDSYDNDYPSAEASQQTSSPTSEDNKDKQEEEPDDLGHVHIVELLRGEESLGIQLVSYTSKGRDLGVFIGEMDGSGFAAKSGKLQLFDRILACNGEDFTQETNRRVEERFREMITKEPLLRIAVSRGLNLDLEQSPEEENGDEKRSSDNPSVQSKKSGESATDDINRGVPSSVTAPASNSVTNTRQLGMKKTIELTRGGKGTFGFGLASRDVATNTDDIPIYVKSITTDGPAFHDGRLKIGDRILEVNGQSVKGMSQPEVLDLLRSSKDSITVVISRQQQANEPQDEYSELSQPSGPAEPLPTTIGKNILVVNIPLDDCGLHGLGVTVYQRCSRKKGEDVGIYIKAILPGGAAAKEGSLRVNDRLLSVNNQSLVNMSNSDALNALKKGLQQAKPGQDRSINLTIARTLGINRKQSLSMSSFSNQMPALQEEESRIDSFTSSQDATEIGIDCPPETRNMSQEVDHGTLYEEDFNFTSQDSPASQLSYGKFQEIPELSVGSFPNSQPSVPVSEVSRTHYGAPSDRTTNFKSSSPSSRRGHTQTSNGPSKKYWRESNSLDTSNDRGLKHMGNARPSNSLRPYKGTDASLMRHVSTSPTISDRVSWYMGDSQSRASSHSPTYSRPSSVHSELSDRSLNHYSHSMTSIQSSIAPFNYGHSRIGSSSFQRKASPPYDTLEQSPTKDNSNGHSDNSPHTLPRYASGRNSDRYSGRSSPTLDDTTSLVSYSSDPEQGSSNPFKRDDKNRISIPKKKSSAQPNLSHFKLDNTIPRLEGEGSPSPPLYRTGSDGDISAANTHFLPKEMFNNIEVGPNLRMAKSSSLESLQTVMHYTIRADVRRDDGSFGRNRSSTRNSFRRAVDRSYSGETIPSSTVISLTKSPQKGKSQRKGILSWLRTKKSKDRKKDKNRRSRLTGSIDGENIEEIARHFGISERTILRMQSHSGRLDGDEELYNDNEAELEDFEDSDEMHSLRHTRAL